MRLKNFRFAFAASLIIFLVALIFGGAKALIPLTALALIEVTFSFENAVINSQVLSEMNRFWQVMFLTVGIIIAVFVVRLFLPILIVAITAGHPLHSVVNSALNDPDTYAQELEAAYPIIAAFGGVFLLMIGLRFFGEKKDVVWLNTIEGPLAEFNQPWWISITGAGAAILVIYTVLAPGNAKIALAGIAGAITFLLIKILSEFLVKRSDGGGKFKKGSHSHGLIQFLYLELLDATFSFDGVIGAFAITKSVLLIAAGLGIGAVWVRSITVQLLRQKTLTQYRYLIHGAHYAILALSLLLLLSIKHEVPQAVTGLLGILIIGLAFESSRRHNLNHGSAH